MPNVAIATTDAGKVEVRTREMDSGTGHTRRCSKHKLHLLHSAMLWIGESIDACDPFAIR